MILPAAQAMQAIPCWQTHMKLSACLGQTHMKIYALFRTLRPKTIPCPVAQPPIGHENMMCRGVFLTKFDLFDILKVHCGVFYISFWQFFFRRYWTWCWKLSLLSILDCFRSEKDGTPGSVKPKIKEFFKTLDEVEHCFYNNSQVLYTYLYNIYLTCHVKEGNNCLYKNISFIIIYISTIECMLWLAAERARFPCNDWALLARCPRHRQSVFNLIVGIRACYGQLTAVKKGYPVISVTWLYHRLKCTTHWGGIFFKLSANQVLVLIDRRLNTSGVLY